LIESSPANTLTDLLQRSKPAAHQPSVVLFSDANYQTTKLSNISASVFERCSNTKGRCWRAAGRRQRSLSRGGNRLFASERRRIPIVLDLVNRS
jgi:hypothetical protein